MTCDLMCVCLSNLTKSREMILKSDGGKEPRSLATKTLQEALVDLEYRSPERVQRDWEQLAVGKVGAMDMWALSEVLRVAFESRVSFFSLKRVFSRTAAVCRFSRIEGGLPRELAVWTRRCADGVPSKRPTAEQVPSRRLADEAL